MESPSSHSKISEEREKHEFDIGQLYRHTFQGKCEEVVKIYETEPEAWSTEVTSSRDTALHIVINDDKVDAVVKLVDIIVNDDHRHHPKEVEALTKANDVKDTPLHRAAARGSVEICECIVNAGTKLGVDDLLRLPNKWDENPIFVSVLDNRKHAFIYFLQATDEVEDELLTSPVNGDTVVHTAIQREHYDLAFHIMQRCPQLLGRCNVRGITPLHILASKPSAFRSGSHLSWWQAIIYHCIRVDPLEYDGLPPTRTIPIRRSEFEHPDNCRTCYQFLSSLRCGGVMAESDPQNHFNSHVKGNVPQNYVTCFQFLFMVLQIFFGVLGFGKTFEGIINARRKHTWSVQILDQLMEDPGRTYMTKDGGDPGFRSFGGFDDLRSLHMFSGTKKYQKGDEKELEASPDGLPDRVRKNKQDEKGDDKNKASRTDSALLVAAQKGIVEVVDKILEQLPASIHDTSSMKKNIVLVAVENRQPRILDALHKHLNEVLKKPQLWLDLVRVVDTEQNTILHLAAKYDEARSHPWQIHGSAMQMQWEIKWYEHVKAFPPSLFVFLTNKKEETPVQIFLRDHQKLVNESSAWLKDMSESCSVVAALVVGVSFATSSQVPGGTNDETGKLKLEGQPAFELFAIY